MGAVGYRGASLEVLVEVLDVSVFTARPQTEVDGVSNGYLQSLPEDKEKTRLALEYLLSERAILGACAAGWEDMERTIDPGAFDENMGDAESA